MSSGAILLTGATGFLGRRLCRELLVASEADVHCLLRDSDTAPASERLRRVAPARSRRLIAVPGDLTAPLLGLTPDRYDELATTVNAVYHCAASVNLAAAYGRTAPVNVSGTERLLTLLDRRAELGRPPARLHFVSSAGVFVTALATGTITVSEGTVPTRATAGPSGYLLSKADAEQRVDQALDRGTDITIHRPGIITGDSATGATSPDTDLLGCLLRAAVALHSIPVGPGHLPMETVDTVARGIVRLSQTAPRGSVFHLTRPVRIDVPFIALQRAGYPLLPVPEAGWYHQVWQHAWEPEVYPAYVVSTASGLTEHTAPRLPVIDSTATYAAARSVGIDAPPLDAPYFDRLVANLIAAGALLPP
ncbi:SDR family oxidoreductase [Kitasatospora sp. NPDC058046]|uniref:SDR family oxidoreductase n=1 Tax=Kitasatospora sp. NPDC058046 TaxID=3346312 RepID=UPI0036DEB4F6